MLARGASLRNAAGNMVAAVRRRVDLEFDSNHHPNNIDDDAERERSSTNSVNSSSSRTGGRGGKGDDNDVSLGSSNNDDLVQINLSPHNSSSEFDVNNKNNNATTTTTAASAENSYTLGDHAKHISLCKETSGSGETIYYCDVGKFFVDVPNMSELIKEYCSPLPLEKLNFVYFEFESKDETATAKQLPVRTLSFRLRPDIICSVVINSIKEACCDSGKTDYAGRVLKKDTERGHIRCLLIPIDGDDENNDDPSSQEFGSSSNSVMPYCVCDATVVTRWAGKMEREVVIRLYHPSPELIPDDDYNDVFGSSSSDQLQQQQQQQQSQSYDSKEFDDVGDSMIPLNQRLKEACCFIQHVSNLHAPAAPDGIGVEGLPSPRTTAKECTAYLHANFDPTFSVNVIKGISNFNRPVYPSLNSEDWFLLQNSWQLISRIWQNLMLDNCPFHTIIDIPVVDSGPIETTEDSPGGLVLDLHYCTQIRQMSRNSMLSEVMVSYKDLQRTLNEKERIFANFIHLLRRTWARYQMKQQKAVFPPPPKLNIPTKICPPGFTIIAMSACKVSKDDPENPAAVVDDAVRKVYRTFSSQDEQIERKHLKESNRMVMDRLVHIQKLQMNMVHEIETCRSAENSAKIFCKLARGAANSKGRVNKLVLARVPLLDIQILNGTCQITSTSFLVRTTNLWGTTTPLLFDLQAVAFEVKSANCLAIVSNQITKETPTNEVYFKMNTSTNVYNLKLFLETLQTLQSVFSIKPEEAVSDLVHNVENDNETNEKSEDGNSHEDRAL